MDDDIEAAKAMLTNPDIGVTQIAHRLGVSPSWSEPDGAWVADAPDLQSCAAFGDTPAQAVAEIEQAIEAWLAVARTEGLAIPQPRYRAPTRAAG